MIILVGSEAGLIFDLDRLQKKYLARCQISSSKSEHLKIVRSQNDLTLLSAKKILE